MYFDYRFQYVLNITDFEKDRLCINTLGNFRRRLVEYEIEHQIDLLNQEVEALSEHLAEFMDLNKSMARMDSFMVSSSCKKLTRNELVYVVIRNMVRTLAKLEDIDVPETFTPYLEKGHQNETLYHTKTEGAKSKLHTLIQQAQELHQFVSSYEVCYQTDAYEHLERLLQEQCVETENGVIVPIDGKQLNSTILQNHLTLMQPFAERVTMNM